MSVERRLGRRARHLVGPLKPENQLDQLLFAELLQITSIHSIMDSGIYPADKGVGNYWLGDLSGKRLAVLVRSCPTSKWIEKHCPLNQGNKPP